MCGIYGSIERANHAPNIVFAGLKDIEYRGYDSWGVAYFNGEGFNFVKDIGFLPQSLELPYSNIALGHTRWATNGGVSINNAHPHTDCTRSLALAHNGVVENANILKDTLVSHRFISQTDTEIIAHLIEEERARLPFSEAVKTVFNKLEGLNAILTSDGKEVVAIKNGSSLIVGKTDSGFLVSSDTNSLLPHTNQLYFLEDREPVVIGNNPINLSFISIPWKYQSADLGNFSHYMLKEIYQVPESLDNLLQVPKQIKDASEIIQDTRNVFLIGCGSSNYANLAGEYLFSKFGRRLTFCCVASEFSSKQPYLTTDDLVISVSQSGETIDLLEQVRLSKTRETKQLAIQNSYGSALYREVLNKVMLNAGAEKAVLATKSFASMLGVYILLANQLGGNYPQGEQIILKSIEASQKVLDNKIEIQQIAKELSKSEHIFTLGRSLSYPIALETALKIKEGSYIHAEGFQGGELKHGVLALIEKDMPVLVFTSSNEEKQNILTNASEVKARDAKVFGIGEEKSILFNKYFSILPTGADSIIPKAVFSQLLSYYLALEKGLNPDKPRHLAKSVTVK